MEGQIPQKKPTEREQPQSGSEGYNSDSNLQYPRKLGDILRNLQKSNREEFETLLAEHNINRLYHFTDRDNLSSIKEKGGLFSYLYCLRNNIVIAKPGGSVESRLLDERKNLHNYVRLSFVKKHPMMFVAKQNGRIALPVILEIDPKVIFLATTKFTTQNAAKNGVFANGSFDTFKQIRFSLFSKNYFDLGPEDRSYYQAEILVLQHLSSENILNLNTL